MKKILLHLKFILLFIVSASAQNLPDEMHFSPDGKRLITGNLPYSGFYYSYNIHDIYINFYDNDYWDDLEDNYDDDDGECIMASIIVDGLQLDSVGVRFKGNTSYSSANDDKKSFNISIDEYIPGQDLFGYESLNLNNCQGDPSYMAEIVYEYQIHKHVPAPKGNFAHLFINGMDWGIYANVQQLNRDFEKEWFMSNDGALFRAEQPPGVSVSNGSDGDSLSSLYYLGSNPNTYMNYYNLKSSQVTNPYTKLMTMTRVMDTVSTSHMESVLGDYLDIDRTLWFLASENAFADDDGYVYEARSDYYIYYEVETGRFVPLEFDANGAMDEDETELDIFVNANKPNYALLYQLLNNATLRQRYLAHYRTLVNDEMDLTTLFNMIDDFYNLIDPIVQNDPVANYSYSDFLNHKNVLKNFIQDRKDYIEDDSEFDKESPVISNTIFYAGTNAWQRPQANQDVIVNSSATSTDGIYRMNLYYADGLVGKFTKIRMYDDGQHDDQVSGDGIYGATIPGQSGGMWMRFYVEAVSDDSKHTVSYDPPGAEHDIYTYLTIPSLASDSAVVINEVMAVNTATVTDSAGEYEDWIELYNTSGVSKDISGYYITDDTLNLIKWQIPVGTIIPPYEYLILWADDQGSEGLYHTNFKINNNGERLLLLNANSEVVNELAFGPQPDDLGYARVPNGTGPFVIKSPTYNFNNNPNPQVSFSSSGVTSGCAPLSLSFTNNSTEATSYLWDFGDGNTSNFATPFHTYNSAGDYTVTLTAINGPFSDVDSIFELVHVSAATPFDFISDTIVAISSSYNLVADPGYVSYNWSNSDTTSSIIVNSSGSYCVVVTSSNTCSDSDCVYVYLNTVGVEDLENRKMNIFPNPANNYFTIDLMYDDPETIYVLNSLGEIIYNEKIEGSALINTEQWAMGVYFLRIRNNIQVITVQH